MSDALASLSEEQLRAFYRRLANQISTGQNSLASALILHWLDGKGTTKTVPATWVKGHPVVTNHLLSEVRPVLLSQTKTSTGKWAGIVPRLAGVGGFKPSPTGIYAMSYEGKSLEIPISTQASLAFKLYQGKQLNNAEKLDLDLLYALHGFNIHSDVVVSTHPQPAAKSPTPRYFDIRFMQWRARMFDYYNWDPKKHISVPNPDYGSKNEHAVRPADRQITVFHSNALRLEKKGLAQSYPVESEWWEVTDAATIKSATVDVTVCAEGIFGLRCH